MTQRNVLEAINSALDEEMSTNPRVMVLGLDVGKLGGVFRATSGLLEKHGAQRVVDTPLAEASIIGASLGLAISGMVPVAEIQFLGFTAQAFHQIGPQLARYRARSRGRYHCQVTIRAPFGGGIHSPEFHSDAVEAQFVQSPGIKIVMPSNAYDAKGLLIEAIRDPDPVLYCEPDRLYRLGRMEVPDGAYTIPFGKAAIVREGEDITLVAWSAAVESCLIAAERLADEGISATVVDLRTLVPFDVETVVGAVAKTGRCVVVHEAPLSAGFGAEVAATLASEAFYDLDAPIARVTSWDVPYPAAPLEGWYLPSVERVVAAARRTAGD
ncbi:MAG TPA: alpha-ketoacid dehydrogenase subunit beta [Methylomirabilota bacterium]|nr:alpha-ketoacid dehydrogenase subunit beta [Methylomirabilota bacterium]HWO92875.1 alpha-ketoacid dehydrogenase subunit beta [Methylomirabilota bacterium]